MDVATHFGLSQDPFLTAEPGAIAGARLGPEAARAYLAGRAAGAGGHDLFGPSALDLLVEAAQGDVERLRQLGSNALFHAASEGAARVEDTHARQAATAQGLWIPTQDPMETARVVAPIAATPVHLAAPELAAAETAVGDPLIRHRNWWRRTPPLTRLAIVVGLLLLSLPVIGFVIGAVKDSTSSTDSSYVPENAVALDDRRTIDDAAALNRDEIPPVDMAATAMSRPPVDLVAQDDAVATANVASLPEPAMEIEPGVPASEVVPDDLAVPAPEIETTPIAPPPAPQ